MNAYTWNLENWYRTFLQGRSRDTDVENRLEDTVGEGEGGTNGQSSAEIHTLPCVKHITSRKLLYSPGSSTRCSVMTRGVGRGMTRAGIYVYI